MYRSRPTSFASSGAVSSWRRRRAAAAVGFSARKVTADFEVSSPNGCDAATRRSSAQVRRTTVLSTPQLSFTARSSLRRSVAGLRSRAWKRPSACRAGPMRFSAHDGLQPLPRLPVDEVADVVGLEERAREAECRSACLVEPAPLVVVQLEREGAE